MSYDLMVFRKEAAPTYRTAFMDWYEHQTEWSEPHSYDDPVNTSPELRNWFMEMIETFPAMSGPYASDDDEENPHLAEYCIGNDVVYASFNWSLAEQAYNQMLAMAEKHGVGFFDVSSDNGDIFFPSDGKLRAISNSQDLSRNQSISVKDTKPWWKLW